MSGASQSITGADFFSTLIVRGRDVTAAKCTACSPMGQSTLAVLPKAYRGDDFFGLFHFAFRVPYIYACFLYSFI